MTKKEKAPPKQFKQWKGANIDDSKFRLDDVEVKRRESGYLKFTLPSDKSQLIDVIKLEFRQYFKSPKLIILYIIAILVPLLQIFQMDVISMLGSLTMLMSGSNSLTSIQYLHYCLILIPTVMVLAMAILCGKTISQEYEGRTCFLNLPLPVKRWVFFTGKFIAISITCISVILVGFGVSMIATNIKYGSIAVDPVVESLIIGLVVMLAFVSTGMFFSSICKKRGGLVSLSLMMFIIPLIPIAVALIDTSKDALKGIWEIFLYTPPFATDAMLISLGWDPTMSLSGFAIGNLYMVAPSTLGTILASLAWAAVFFIAGIILFNRREV